MKSTHISQSKTERKSQDPQLLLLSTRYANTACVVQSSLLASPWAPSILWTIVSHCKESPSSSINVIYNYVGPQSLVTKSDTRPQRTSVVKKSQEFRRAEATPPNGNTDGCTQHSLLSVGLNLNQLTDQWMQTADQTT